MILLKKRAASLLGGGEPAASNEKDLLIKFNTREEYKKMMKKI